MDEGSWEQAPVQAAQLLHRQLRGDPGVPATLTATITSTTGCWAAGPATFAMGCLDDGAGSHFWSASSALGTCGAQLPDIACVAGVPTLSLGGGITPVTAQAGYTCDPFSAVFLVNDGAGNSCTVTVTG